MQVHPLIFQSYKSLMCFLTSWLVLIYSPFGFTWWATLAALIWVNNGESQLVKQQHGQFLRRCFSKRVNLSQMVGKRFYDWTAVLTSKRLQRGPYVGQIALRPCQCFPTLSATYLQTIAEHHRFCCIHRCYGHHIHPFVWPGSSSDNLECHISLCQVKYPFRKCWTLLQVLCLLLHRLVQIMHTRFLELLLECQHVQVNHLYSYIYIATKEVDSVS